MIPLKAHLKIKACQFIHRVLKTNSCPQIKSLFRPPRFRETSGISLNSPPKSKRSERLLINYCTKPYNQLPTDLKALDYKKFKKKIKTTCFRDE